MVHMDFYLSFCILFIETIETIYCNAKDQTTTRKEPR